MFILVNIIVVSALLLMLSCLAFVVLLMTCILTNFLVVFNREMGGGGGLFVPMEASLIWFFTVLREERECEMVCVLLDFKQYFRSRVTALIIFFQCCLNCTTSYTKAE